MPYAKVWFLAGGGKYDATAEWPRFRQLAGSLPSEPATAHRLRSNIVSIKDCFNIYCNQRLFPSQRKRAVDTTFVLRNTNNFDEAYYSEHIEYPNLKSDIERLADAILRPR